MPIYEYECTSCGHTFEIQQKFSDKPKSRCPSCRAKIRRVIHPAGIIFKGGGWYINDSRSGSEQEKFKGDGKKPPKDSSEPVTGDAGTSGGEDKVEAVDGSKEASSSSVESKAKSNNPPASSASSND